MAIKKMTMEQCREKYPQGRNCCLEQAENGQRCTIPKTIPHREHQAWCHWGEWEDPDNDEGQRLKDCSRSYEEVNRWENEDHVEGEIPLDLPINVKAAVVSAKMKLAIKEQQKAEERMQIPAIVQVATNIFNAEQAAAQAVLLGSLRNILR